MSLTRTGCRRQCAVQAPPCRRVWLAFTLIELLIVVAIIGILAAIAIPNLQQSQLRARVARVEAELRAVTLGYLQYNMETQLWPPHLDGDSAQHRFVTTPVAYITTSILDVFQPPKQVGKTDVYLTVSRGQYHVEPSFVQYGRMFAMSKDYAARNRNAAYWVWSFGPDLDHEADRARIYDPTNGIRSNGDMYRTIDGLKTRYFPYSNLDPR